MITVLLVLGWISAILIGLGIAAMAYHVGNGYAFTAPGVSRMGPKPGRYLGDLPITLDGNSITISQLTSNYPYTLLLFFDVYGNNTIDLLRGLVQFSSLAENSCHIVASYVGDLHVIDKTLLQALHNQHDIHLHPIADEYSKFDLQRELEIRVNPFAILLDGNAVVVSKGLVNGLPHFCFLINHALSMAKGSPTYALLHDIAIACNPHLPEEMRVA
jgi:hypothetical protein